MKHWKRKSKVEDTTVQLKFIGLQMQNQKPVIGLNATLTCEHHLSLSLETC
jgi:hypothetical protein